MNLKKIVSGVGGSVLVATLAAACAEPPPMILVRGAATLSDDCVAEAEPTAFRGGGVLDVSVATGYTLYPNVENIAPVSSSTGTQGGGSSGSSSTWPDLSGETNRVVLEQAAVSFEFRTSGVPDAVTSVFNSFKFPIGGSAIDPGGGTASVAVPVLNGEHIEQLRNVLQPNQSILLEVSVVLSGKSTGDRDVESNTLTFPIEICTQCLIDSTCVAGEIPICNMGQDDLICTGAAMDSSGAATP